MESLVAKVGAGLRSARATTPILAIMISLAACGGEVQSANAPEASGTEATSEERATQEATRSEATRLEATRSEAKVSDEAAELARAEVGEREISNMLPADGKKPDPARPLPENPPEGIEVYPATTNRTTREPIDYEREPPTNGDHDPLWQNCGFYQKPIKDRHAVHSMDHGVVWITHSPTLPADEVSKLRSYGGEDYVIVSPYPGQGAPVIATSWRVQLELNGASDPRLRRFVDQFRVSELAPLSGNRCARGVGNPAA